MRCTSCGMPLSPNRSSANCPRCGTPLQNVQKATATLTPQQFDQSGWGQPLSNPGIDTWNQPVQAPYAPFAAPATPLTSMLSRTTGLAACARNTADLSSATNIAAQGATQHTPGTDRCFALHTYQRSAADFCLLHGAWPAQYHIIQSRCYRRDTNHPVAYGAYFARRHAITHHHHRNLSRSTIY